VHNIKFLIINKRGSRMKSWNELKKQGSQHYKANGGVEPVDLYVSGNMFQEFALCSIIKYAFRSRPDMKLDNELFLKNMDKIIDYSEKLKASVQDKPKQTLFEKYRKGDAK
jgi:hypothetical protein